MDKKSTFSALVVCSLASSVFANGILNKLLIKHPIPSSTITKTLTKTNDAYTDFSGTWVGDCGDNQKMITVIENTRDYINFDNAEAYRIGKGLQGTYRANDESNNYEHLSLEWNQDGSTLTMQGVYVSKNNTDSTPIWTMLMQANITKKNGQLNIDGKIVGLEGITQVPEQDVIHCVYSKKQ